jgi:hypothetical protein
MRIAIIADIHANHIASTWPTMVVASIKASLSPPSRSA